MRRKFMVAAAMLTAAALVVAGCGSDDGNDSAAAGPTGTTGNLTGPPVKIMQIYSGDGQGFAGYNYAVTAAKAAVDAVNAAGGIKGRPLEMVTCDDAFQPNKAIECGRRAVSEQVVAVVGAYSGLGDNWMPALTKANIPCIGCAGYSSAESTSPMFYPIGISAAAAVVGVGLATCALGAKKPALVYVGHKAGAFLAKSYNTGLKACGLTAKEISIEQGGADFTSQAAQATDGTDLVATIVGQPDLNKLLAAIAATGKTPAVIENYSGAYGDFFSAAPSLMGKNYVQSQVVPSQVDSPATKQFNEEIDKFVPNASSLKRVDATEVVWAAVHIAAQMIEKTTNPDPASLLAVMKTQSNVQFGPTSVVDWTAPVESFKPQMVYSTQLYIAKVTGDEKFAPAFAGDFFDITKGVPTPIG